MMFIIKFVIIPIIPIINYKEFNIKANFFAKNSVNLHLIRFLYHSCDFNLLHLNCLSFIISIIIKVGFVAKALHFIVIIIIASPLSVLM